MTAGKHDGWLTSRMHFFGHWTQKQTVVKIILLQFNRKGQDGVMSVLFFLALVDPHQIHQSRILTVYFVRALIDYFEHIERADVVLLQIRFLKSM